MCVRVVADIGPPTQVGTTLEGLLIFTKRGARMRDTDSCGDCQQQLRALLYVLAYYVRPHYWVGTKTCLAFHSSYAPETSVLFGGEPSEKPDMPACTDDL